MPNAGPWSARTGSRVPGRSTVGSRGRFLVVPVIAFDNADNGGDGQPDWFDLSVRVTVGGERVPFDALFVALSQDQRYLILTGGGYFGLDRPEFRQLRELIEEARALEDAPPGTLRVGRYQAGLRHGRSWTSWAS